MILLTVNRVTENYVKVFGSLEIYDGLEHQAIYIYIYI